MVTEGVNLVLYCGVQHGTVPITFTWYRRGVMKPLNTTQISKTQGFHTIKSITRNDEGRYYCEARNEANKTVESFNVDIQGHTSPTFYYIVYVKYHSTGWCDAAQHELTPKLIIF